MRVVHARREIVGSEMFARAREQLDHEPPRGRDPPAFGAQRVECSRALLAHDRLPLRPHTARQRARDVQLQRVRIWPELWI